ncbi:MAG: Uma2 family endonuclease [Bacteroidota bacterium]
MGRVFDSSTGFKLPNGAIYSPDVAWLPSKKWESLAKVQREKFVPLCPDFICELASSKKQVKDLKDKMQEFIDNGCRLGWLIDPYDELTYVYLPDKPTEEIPFKKVLTGKGVLKGLRVKMQDLLEM